MSVEEILDQLIFLNHLTGLEFSFDVSDNLYFYSIPIRNISDKFTIKGTFVDIYNQVISPLQHFSTLDFPTANHEKHKLSMG